MKDENSRYVAIDNNDCRESKCRYSLTTKCHHPRTGKISKAFAGTCGDKSGRTPIHRKMVDNKASHKMVLIFLGDQIEETSGRVYNAKEKIVIPIEN